MKSTINNPEHSLPYHLRGAFRGFETTLTRYLKTVDLPISHFHILRLQWDEAGYSQSFIAKKSFMTQSVAAQVIRQMIEFKLLKRAIDPTDRRRRLVSLTPKGLGLREKVMTEGLTISTKHAPTISRDDAITTIRVLKTIRQAFEAYNEEYFENT